MKRLLLIFFPALLITACGSGGTMQVCEFDGPALERCIYYHWTPRIPTEPADPWYALDTSCRTQQQRPGRVNVSGKGTW